jgi:hypothetical protein
MPGWIGNGLRLLRYDIYVCRLGHFRSVAVLMYLRKKQFFVRKSAIERILKLKTPWPLVRKQTIPTERPPLVGEVSANFLRIKGVAWSAQRVPLVVNSVFLTGAATFPFK